MFTATDSVDAARDLLASVPSREVVAVPIFNAFDKAQRCFQSLLAHTPPAVPLLLVDDCSTDLQGLAALEEVGSRQPGSERPVVLLKRPRNVGFVGTANLIFDVCGRADVVVVNSDVVVAAGWLEGLREAADASTTLASVTAMTNHGAIVSVPDRNRPGPDLPPGIDVDTAAQRIREGSPKLSPRLPTAIGHCVYFRRLALDVVGKFDEAFGTGYGEEVDWSQRALAWGFEHVLADDVFVYHQGGASFLEGGDRKEQQHRGDALVAERYPYYIPLVRQVERDRNSPLAASLLAARRSVLGLSVLVDGLCLGRSMTGTQKVVLELTRAIATSDRVARITLLTPKVLPAYARSALEGVPKLRYRPAVVGHPVATDRADVAVRPYQVTAISELYWLARLAERVIVGQLDFIAFDNPAYFATFPEWAAYRATQSLVLAAVDGVTFISSTIHQRALASGLLPQSTPARVTFVGTNDAARAEDEESKPPAGCQGLGPDSLLVLGASFLHKNRSWALRVAQRLHQAGWSGHLVLAGPEPSHGSSQAVEGTWLAAHPEVAPRVIRLGAVSEAEKRWLYRHTALVLYPTTSEGFGMIPFEAAHHGVPCLSTRQGSLDEVLPEDLLTLESLDPDQGARLVEEILAEPDVRRSMVAAVERRAARYTWDSSGEEMVELMWQVTGRPRNSLVAMEVGGDVAALHPIASFGLVRRLLDPWADYVRRSNWMLTWVLPPGTRRGQASRRLYHAAIADRSTRMTKPSDAPDSSPIPPSGHP